MYDADEAAQRKKKIDVWTDKSGTQMRNSSWRRKSESSGRCS